MRNRPNNQPNFDIKSAFTGALATLLITFGAPKIMELLQQKQIEGATARTEQVSPKNPEELPTIMDKYPELWRELQENPNVRVILGDNEIKIIAVGELLDTKTLKAMEETGLNFKRRLSDPIGSSILPDEIIPLEEYVAKETRTRQNKF